MKVTYNWLKDFVEIKISAKALADKLTMAGLEVTSLEEKDADFVFEIEVTSNRPDCLSVLGIAREVAAITGKKLKNVSGIRYQVSGKKVRRATCDMRLEIEDKQDCPLYTAKIIRDVKVAASPDWLRKRLKLVDCRSVNNIVDITNYILFEYGEPLHAFDLDKLVSGLSGYRVIGLNIGVRRAKEKEELITIDGVKRALDKEVLIITSGFNSQTRQLANSPTDKPIAIAGIMGGKDTEVTPSTKNILLEAAIFNPVVIRRGQRKLGIQSESSYRFERGIDVEVVERAAWGAVGLIQELSGGNYILTKTAGSAKAKKRDIVLDLESARKILGINIAAGQTKAILSSLGFKLKPKTKDSFCVQVPSHRQDVAYEIDLVEEIARIYGYDLIPKSLPAVKPRVTVDEKRDLLGLIKNILVGLGLSEVITYSLMDKEKLQDLVTSADASAIEILNPLSKEQEILRPMLLPGLLNCAALNLNQKQDYIYIFEIASVFAREDGHIKEELALSIAACGSKSLLLQQGLIREEMGLLHLKGALGRLFERLGVKEYKFHYADNLDRIEVNVGKEKIGFLRQFPGHILEKFEIKNKKVCGLEISLDKLFSYVDLNKKFAALPIYPGITRDLSLVLKDTINAEDVLAVIAQKAQPLLKELKVIDYYTGKQISPGFKGLTISCLYRSTECTLTESEVDSIQTIVSEALTKEFGAKLRA